MRRHARRIETLLGATLLAVAILASCGGDTGPGDDGDVVDPAIWTGRYSLTLADGAVIGSAGTNRDCTISPGPLTFVLDGSSPTLISDTSWQFVDRWREPGSNVDMLLTAEIGKGGTARLSFIREPGTRADFHGTIDGNGAVNGTLDDPAAGYASPFFAAVPAGADLCRHPASGTRVSATPTWP